MSRRSTWPRRQRRPPSPASQSPRSRPPGMTTATMSRESLGTIALLLIGTLIAIPVIAFTVDRPLTPAQVALLKEVVTLMLAVSLLCFVVGEITGNVSQIDKLWSIIPVVYCWWIAAGSDWQPRAVLMSLLATAW